MSNATIFSDVIPIIKHHHERFDGNGYPSKLSGGEIPYLARIASIADAFDAMTSRRSYRDKLPLEFVKSEFLKAKGTQFDSNIVDTFLNILDNNYDEIEQIQKI